MSTLCRKFKDEEGVSEVVGTILTLGITVVLFSSVYAAVTNLEAPEQRDHVEMVVDYEREGDIDYINITHQSGRSLNTGSLVFNLFADDASEERLRIDDEEVNVEGDYDTWSVGEKVWIEGEIFEFDDTNLELVIQNEDTNRVVYQTRLVEEIPDQLDIKNAYISYIHDWRNYAEQDENITIVAVLRNIGDLEDEDIDVTATVAGEDNPFEGDDSVTLTRGSRRGRYEKNVRIAPEATEKSYSVKITVGIGENINEEYVRLNVGRKPAERYPKELEMGRIEFYPKSPSHGDDLLVEAEIYNQGPTNFTTNWTMIDHYKGQSEEVAIGTRTFSHGPAPTDISGEFNIEGSGPHEIEIKVFGDDEWEGVERSFVIHVDPHVLVIEDRSADELHELELMTHALDGLNLDHDTRSLGEYDDLDDIDINYERHSVVIWMTGNKTEGEETSLLGEEAGDLAEYIEEHNGTVWLKGSNLDEIGLGELEGKLGDPEFSDSEERARKLKGEEDGTFGDFEFGILSQEEHPSISNPDTFDKENRLMDVDDEDEVFGVGYEDDEDEYRTATTSFLFRSIEDPGMRTALVGEVIGWMTNITVRSGVDVAVTSQTIEPSAPMYEDEIEITARFRNNGPVDLTLNNTARLVRNQGEEVMSPPEDANLFLPANGGTAKVIFTWTANELGVQDFLVKADYFGEINQVRPQTNDIRYKENLDITGDQRFVNVHYSTLVVDAEDLSEEGYSDTTRNIIDSFEKLGHVEDRDFELFEVGVDSEEDGPDDEKMGNYNAVFWITGERDYEGEDEPDIFTDNDLSSITNYLGQENGANMMFIGEYMLDFLEDSNHEDSDELIEKLGIDDDEINDRKETTMLMGQENNPVGHGLRYTLEGGVGLNYTTFQINENDDAAEILFKGDGGENFASTYDDGSTKTVYMGVNPDRIIGPLMKEGAFDDWPGGEVDTSAENAITEFVYTSLWSFGKSTEGIERDGQVQLEGRAELRVTDYDIRLTTDRPHTGRSYEIRAEIENIGDRGASTLVRFHDGEDYIGAENLFVEASERSSEAGSSYFEVEPGTATAELSWRASEPGIRSLIVRVDPEREVNEIEDDDGNKIMEFNNQAEIDQPVYFFYDDMERGEEKWRHDETLVNIDGTGPLDFVDRRDLDTNVVGNWSDEYSGMTLNNGASFNRRNGTYETDEDEIVEFTDKAHYSNPRSYWMPETPSDEDAPEDYTVNTSAKYRYLTTRAIDIEDTTAEILSFRTKYWMTQDNTGGMIYLWGNDEDNEWSWEQDNIRHIKPQQPYTGDLDFDDVEAGPNITGLNEGIEDREGEIPDGVFNGKSASGTFGWQYISADLSQYDNFMEDFEDLRVVFLTIQLDSTEEDDWYPEKGWYIDNVKLRATREFEGEVPDDDHGYWMRVNKEDVINKFDGISENDSHITEGHYDDNTPGEEGEGYFWMFARNDDGEPALPKGVDSSLYTSRIDLSNANRPELSAYMKFNLDNRAGTPPDGLRIEISEDDGRTWDSLTYGIRSGWGVSGEVPNNIEDLPEDTEEWVKYSGGSDGYDWVSTDSLSRVTADLSGWRGENIILRFRLFTNTTETYEDELEDFHYDENYPKAVFIDDVIVKERVMRDNLDSTTQSISNEEDTVEQENEVSSLMIDEEQEEDQEEELRVDNSDSYLETSSFKVRYCRFSLLSQPEINDIKKFNSLMRW